jgi:amino acid transporter
MNEHPSQATPDGETATHLGLWDAVSIIVGIVVGTAIFKTPQLVFGNVENAWWGMFAWALGGVLALVGSFCYAELATTYPRMGGDYVYLTRAFRTLCRISVRLGSVDGHPDGQHRRDGLRLRRLRGAVV